jgi:hypothetical protein
MAWRIHDEFIDLPQGRHVVVFHNPDTGAEHQLIHQFHLDVCPHCGHPNVTEEGEPIDFHQIKADTLEALNEHHQKSMAYREKHPHVRLGSEPK